MFDVVVVGASDKLGRSTCLTSAVSVGPRRKHHILSSVAASMPLI
jgi:hypothetical protein